MNGHGTPRPAARRVVRSTLGPVPSHAVQWDEAGRMTDPGVLPGGNYSTSWRISARGTSIGQGDVNWGEHAVLWRVRP